MIANEVTVVQRIRAMAVVLAAVTLVGCAAGKALGRADEAAKTGDWDAAVAYYREALLHDPDRLEARVRLEHATRMASAAHIGRARELEAQEFLPGAVAEYRLAADLDPSNTMALTKAINLERQLREQMEAARPPSRMEELQAAAAQQSPFPTLDPRTRVPAMRFPNAAVRDILRTISDFTGINVTYDQGMDSFLSRPYSIDVQDVPLVEVLNQVLTANQLTFKVVNPQTIFVYQDTPQKRSQFEELYVQTFYLSHADATEVQQLLTQLTQTGPAVRPVIQPQKGANALVVKATAPVLEVITEVIRSVDKPRAEVVIDIQILEVDRQRARQLGLDLGSYALGFTFSPGGAPGAGGVPPFNLNQASNATSRDVYMSVPSAQLKLLESDTKTKVLAKPQLRGMEGATLTLNLGDDIPVAQTTFGAYAAGGVQTVPQTSYTYRRVGVNVTMTPRVTYADEIILDPLTVEKSGLGANIDVAGVSLPSFVSRQATTSMRLRDGESNLLAGLIREEDRELLKGIPGLMSIPGLRRLFGVEDSSFQQSDIVMIVTPHIVRSRELTADDLRPLFVGTGTNLSTSMQPQLISPGAPPPPAGAPPSPATGAVTPPAQVQTPPGAELPPVSARAPGVVPIQPVTAAPAEPGGIAQIAVTLPPAEWQAGGPPYTVPIAVAGVSRLGTVALTITYDPTVLRAVSVTQGSFMAQGGVSPAFAPQIDEQAGRIDLVITRTGDEQGASGDGLLAGVVFEAIGPGSTQITLAGVASDTTGKAIPARLVPGSVTVR
ncbi:MAG TPA: secretin N-terminal domain-containing protein [Vicinamibacterales bacterium]|nr:secretin N-terminal domain-containing protein [Vicinamibacterales bacterium]